MWHVYGLIDPRTDQPFYIGMTKDCNQRLSQHRSKGAKPEIRSRIQEIAAGGHDVGMRIIAQFTTYKRAALKEMAVIQATENIVNIRGCSPAKTERINMRGEKHERAIIERAAKKTGVTITQFLLRASLAEAKSVLANLK